VLALAFATLLTPATGAAPSAAPFHSSPALSAFRSAWAAVTAYNATITVFEQKGSKVQTVVFKYTFRKPSTVTVDVVGGPNNGVSLLWAGGATVSAHRGSGPIRMFKKALSLHDPLVTTIRGSSIDQLSFSSILAHAQSTLGTLTERRGPTINNVATTAVTLIPVSPAANAGYTREVLEISTTTHLPLRVLGYQGPALVREIDFVDVRLTH